LLKASFLLLTVAAALGAQNFSDLRPSPQQVAWQDLEIGAIIHFGPNTFLNQEWGDGTADPKIFNPTQFDPNQWMLAAKSAGVKYVVFVAKHHDGFCLWPSHYTDYSVKSSPWKNGHGDVVREVAEAARRNGLKFGVYLSPWDRHEPSYKNNAAYDVHYRQQLEELASHYGDLVEFWLDGAGSAGHVYDFDSYIETLRTYQQNALIFADVGFLKYGDIRWVGNESGLAKETNWNVVDRLGYLRWRPAEADTPLRKLHWFWHPNDEKSLKSLDELVDTYNKTVGRGAQLMLGLAPDNRGLLPDSDVARLREFGDAVNNIYGHELGRDCNFMIGPAPATYFTVSCGKPTTFDRAVTMEDLTQGQHVMEYEITADVGGQSKVLYRGTTIGHKKIDIFPAVTATTVSLHVIRSVGEPHIRSFRVYSGASR